jgi:hypothetical protein
MRCARKTLIPYAGAERRQARKPLRQPEPMTFERLLLRELTEIAMRLNKLQDQRRVLARHLAELKASQ